MVDVYLSLGSNIDAQKNIIAALDALQEDFGELKISSVFESEAVGFSGDNFYNLVVAVKTELNVGELSQHLKDIEDANGRKRCGPKFSGRTLDIDILTYGNAVGNIDGVELPRAEILTNAFVLWPLTEVVTPACQHPEVGHTYVKLWSDYDKTSQKLWPIDFIWQQQVISKAGRSKI